MEMASHKKHTVIKIKDPSPHGKSVSFENIDSGGMQARTWLGYIKFIVKFYKQFKLPDKNMFYWEFLSAEANIREIIKTVLNNYYIKDGDALAAKLSPFRSVVFRLTCSLDAITSWGETIIDVRANFDRIIGEYGDQIRLKRRYRQNNPMNKWTDAYKQLHDISIDKESDIRVRVLATLYKYGYIFRMSVIFRTYIELPDGYSSREYHYLDLDNQTWSLMSGGMKMVEFQVPYRMSRELKVLTRDDTFAQGWLLPQRRGFPYASEASISSFSSWTKLGLFNYRAYHRMFKKWLKAGTRSEEYELFFGVLDQHMSMEIIQYMPPLPSVEVAEPRPQSPEHLLPIDKTGKEISPDSGVEVEVDADADADASSSSDSSFLEE
jgi:hypothetical protein